MRTQHSSEWVLTEHNFDGVQYLIDLQTGKAFTRDSPDRWPRSIGTVRNGTLVLAQPAQRRSLFAALDAYLRQERVRLRELFDSHDMDGSGSLEAYELARLVKEVMPNASKQELLYFEVRTLADRTFCCWIWYGILLQ